MADSGTGGEAFVTLVVPPSAVVPAAPGTPVVVVSPRTHLPFTGYDLSTALVLSALLLALGTLLILTGRWPVSPDRRI